MYLLVVTAEEKGLCPDRDWIYHYKGGLWME